LFSISQTSRGFFCLEWLSTENGPQIITTKHLKINNDFKDKFLLKNIVSQYESSINNESNSLSVIVSSDNVLISSIDTSSDEENIKMIKWYESNLMGADLYDKYHNYYYPMKSNKNNKFLIISFPKNIKNNIMKSAIDLKLNLIYLSVDIFSAAVFVQHQYQKDIKYQYVLWKINKNNKHTIILYKEKLIYAYVVIKKYAKKCKQIIGIGNNSYVEDLTKLADNILVHKFSDENIKNIFIYQTKESTEDLRNILNLGISSIKVLSFNKLIENRSKNNLKYINYIENGICFKGLDLL